MSIKLCKNIKDVKDITYNVGISLLVFPKFTNVKKGRRKKS